MMDHLLFFSPPVRLRFIMRLMVTCLRIYPTEPIELNNFVRVVLTSTCTEYD